MKQDEGKTNEVEANPYNRKKYWHTADVMPKSVPDADSGPAQPDPEKKTGFDYANRTTTNSSNPNVLSPSSTATSDKVEDSPLSNVEVKPYTKVDYKKRYDDLKRYYDRKLGEWSNKEGDLKAQLRDNRPKYTPPKSADELSAFKKDYPDIYGVVETVSHLQSQTEMKVCRKKLTL